MPTGAEIAGLTWVADFLKTVLSAVAGDRLKPRTSAERAKTYAFDAYEALARLKESSVNFVLALEYLPQTTGFSVLYHTMDDVSRCLETLRLSLSRINYQLEIHAPKINNELIYAVGQRGTVLRRVAEILVGAQSIAPEELPDVIEEAKEALVQIESAVESLRTFLASEFTFKESF